MHIFYKTLIASNKVTGLLGPVGGLAGGKRAGDSLPVVGMTVDVSDLWSRVVDDTKALSDA